MEADEGDMTKTEMLRRIRRLENMLEQTNERLELLRAVVMEGGPDRVRAMVATHGG